MFIGCLCICLSFANLSAFCHWLLVGKVGGCDYVIQTKTIEKNGNLCFGKFPVLKNQVVILFIQQKIIEHFCVPDTVLVSKI